MNSSPIKAVGSRAAVAVLALSGAAPALAAKKHHRHHASHKTTNSATSSLDLDLDLEFDRVKGDRAVRDRQHQRQRHL